MQGYRMSLYAINPFETVAIVHPRDYTAKSRITRSVQELPAVLLLKRHRIHQRTATADFDLSDHNEERARSCLSLELWRRTGK